MKGVQQYRPRTTRSLAIVSTCGDTSSALSHVVAIERLRMAQDHFHVPVLLNEIVAMFSDQRAGVLVDASQSLQEDGRLFACCDGDRPPRHSSIRDAHRANAARRGQWCQRVRDSTHIGNCRAAVVLGASVVACALSRAI